METIFGEVEVLPDEKSDGMKAIEVFRRTAEDIRELDFVTKEKAQALVHYVLQSVAMDLANSNIPAVIETYDKIRAAETYVKAKYRKQHADLATANTITAGRIQVLREFGRWLKEHYNEQGINRGVRMSGEQTSSLIVYRDDLVNWGFRNARDAAPEWKRLADIPDDDFLGWVMDYLSPDAEEELYYKRAYRHFFPKKKSKHPEQDMPPDEPLAMLPHINAVYRWVRDGNNVLQTMIQGVGEGKTPRYQIVFAIEQLSELQKEIQKAKIQIGELY